MAEAEVGKVYEDCSIVGVHPFGCFVELFPGKEGLVRASCFSSRTFVPVKLVQKYKY